MEEKNTNPKDASVVRTRFAPSPTGFMHIGSVRTALFCFLLAKANNGKFILRIEDTDRERFVEGATEDIIEALNWLGLKYDEGPQTEGPFRPYYQSQRLDLYKKHAEDLLNHNKAFLDEGAIRFKTEKDGSTTWHDLIGDKDITFENRFQEDFVILKSDGYPTYNFANVIDDHYMEISHVIRGPEFISSTPKHLMLYKALGWEPPKFAHVPMILGTDRSKLSKRHGAKPALDFRKDGYLSEAILNYMAFLGWTPPSGKEIISTQEMASEFDINDINVASPIFDIVKLDWLNGEYIRNLTDEKLTAVLNDFLVDHPGKDKISVLVPLIKERIKKLSDFVPLTDFIFENPEYDKSVFNKIRIDDKKEALRKVMEKLTSMPSPWKADVFETTFRKMAEEEKIPVRDMFQLIRVAVSGQLVTPPLFESIEIIGEEYVLKRLELLIEKFDSIPDLTEKIKS